MRPAAEVATAEDVELAEMLKFYGGLSVADYDAMPWSRRQVLHGFMSSWQTAVNNARRKRGNRG